MSILSYGDLQKYTGGAYKPPAGVNLNRSSGSQDILTYKQLQKYTGGAYRPPVGVDLNAPSVRQPLTMTPQQRDYLNNYVQQKQAVLPPPQTYVPPTPQLSQPTYEELLADYMGFASGEVEKATAPLLETIAGLQSQVTEGNTARIADNAASAAARQTSAMNSARSQSASNFQVEPASKSAATSSADAFKIRGRRSATGTSSQFVLPSTVNI